jgi:hypothetical protein
LGTEISFQATCHCRLFVGYNLIYWGNVSRSSDQIDLNLDPRNFPPQIPGGLPFPSYQDKTSNFWAQGINLGAEFRF